MGHYRVMNNGLRGESWTLAAFASVLLASNSPGFWRILGWLIHQREPGLVLVLFVCFLFFFGGELCQLEQNRNLSFLRVVLVGIYVT